ncbi:type II membrane protein [Stygiomarasmius scandens]|uniref:Autophagy-related protein 27 n=1 Tax=Marasmiellus scandens TaxID=2682957 RepID=A0ABR1K5H6_9AGAR
MNLRHLTLNLPPCSLFFYLLWSMPSALSKEDSPFSCQFSVGSKKFDLTSLGGVHTVNRTRSTPPTEMRDVLSFNLCEDLEVSDQLGTQDQCPEGTRACLTVVNLKNVSEPERIVSVIPIAQNASYSTLSLPEGISLIFQGARYPESSSPQHYFNITLLCNDDASDPKFKSYNGSGLQAEWSTPVVCASEGEDGDEREEDGNGNNRSYGSGLGWFFLVLLLAFAAYFGIGAYYNYTTYGASGMDLIPHRDFWKEVPYLLSDVVSHLCSTFRSRRTSSRGGYIAV